MLMSYAIQVFPRIGKGQLHGITAVSHAISWRPGSASLTACSLHRARLQSCSIRIVQLHQQLSVLPQVIRGAGRGPLPIVAIHLIDL